MKLSNFLIPLYATTGTSETTEEGFLEPRADQLKSNKRRNLLRYVWRNPMCRDITKCQCGGTLGSGREKSGEIVVGRNIKEDKNNISVVKYKERESCMWHITVPAGYHLKMQFDKEYGFDVEYHNFCGFDKIHILEGHFGANQQFKKVGRFCGPRPGEIGESRPWDGRRQLFDDTGNMEFWDKPFIFEGHKATIAWDSDQTKVQHKGFKLKWWAERKQSKTLSIDTLQGALHIITRKIRPLIQAQNTVPIRVKRNQLRQLDNVMGKLEAAVSEKGPNGEKSCSDMTTWEPPSDKLRAMLLEEHELETWLSKSGPIVAYAEYYIGLCKNYNWDKRVFNIWKKTLNNMGRVKRIRF